MVTSMLSASFGLSLSDKLMCLSASAVGVYYVFKHYEPLRLTIVIPLLTIPPAIATTLLLPNFSYLTAALCSFILYYAVIVLSVIMYRLSPFHPLAQYPGPLHLKLSKASLAWINYQGHQHTYIQSLHQQYGDVVRVGPNEIFIRDATAVVPLMGSTGLPKGPAWSGRQFHPPVRSLIAIYDNGEHVERRKAWTRAFNSAALKGYEEIIRKRSTQLVDELVSHKTVNLGAWFGHFTFDFMSDMAFGGGSEMMRDGDQDSIWAQMDKGLKSTALYGNMPWLPYYAKRIPSLGAALQKFRSFGIERARERVMHGSPSKDLFYYLNNEDGKLEVPRPLAHVISDGALAVIAGADTTSGILTHLFYFLLSHPESYKRLQREVDEYYPPGRDALDTKNHGDMPYLAALLNESMRLLPALPSGSQRTTKGVGPRYVGPYYIPDDTQVSIHTYSLQRDPRYFSSPEKFWPERWLVAEDPALQAQTPGFVHDLAAFIPFSFGPKNCVGKNLAQQEMRMVVCLVMQQLAIQFAPGYDSAEYLSGLKETLIQQKGVLPVVVERRGTMS